ncbi:hypothetical protein EUGRSUZ_G01288 [Eucalyptus grandis]|uniref:Uncharacterized protein n=2 Tax=Eucalyptus grandis TaxID=71139 RepID=A0ACC3K2M1_EUCGR|nr:hypothetical protein EUGRSUZ_G01288 [Eucalyptus grandis]
MSRQANSQGLLDSLQCVYSLASRFYGTAPASAAQISTIYSLGGRKPVISRFIRIGSVHSFDTPEPESLRERSCALRNVVHHPLVTSREVYPRSRVRHPEWTVLVGLIRLITVAHLSFGYFQLLRQRECTRESPISLCMPRKLDLADIQRGRGRERKRFCQCNSQFHMHMKGAPDPRESISRSVNSTTSMRYFAYLAALSITFNSSCKHLTSCCPEIRRETDQIDSSIKLRTRI